MLKKLYLILILFLLFIQHGYTQFFSMIHLDVTDGLSNNYVLDIEQDGQGFIWIATESGLNRFDGKNFTAYKENNSNLINNAVNALLYDPETNKLWIGTKSGISLYNCSSQLFEDFKPENDVVITNVSQFSKASDNGIWITNRDEAIYHYNARTNNCTKIEFKHKSNLCTYESSNGYLYVGHTQNGLTIIDQKQNYSENYIHDPNNSKSLPGNSVYSICKDHAGNLWLGTNQGLALFKSETKEFIVFKHESDNPYSLIADHIYSLEEMNDGTLWIATDIGGISILNVNDISFMSPDSIKFRNIEPNTGMDGLSSGNTRSLLQDLFGNIWIGNYSTGVDFISHTLPVFNTLPYFMDNHLLKYKPVWGIYADDEQQVWLGGENEIVVYKNGKFKKKISIIPHLTRSYGQVFSICRYDKETLLLGIYDNGLLKLNLKNNKIERVQLGEKNTDVITFFQDTDGVTWIGTEYGIYTYSNNKVQWEESINNQLPDKSIYGILRDEQGKLWVGTYAGGIAIFNRDNKIITELSTSNGFCSNSVCQLFLDSQGAVWTATRKGIGYIKDTNNPLQFELYDDKNGLNEYYVRAIQEDKSNNIWISTNDGISLWNKEKQKFYNYDIRDGVPIGNFIEGSACMTADGTTYFGSLNGVCFFNPADAIIQQKVAPVKIIECKKLSKQVENPNDEITINPINGKINLSYKQNSFRFSFSVPDYSQTQQIEYVYMMNGLDDIWYNTQGENYVTFRGISPGEYTFKVKARLKNGEWDETHIVAMNISISPPLWFTWYAKLFYIIVIFLFLYAWMRFYKRKVNLEHSLEAEITNNRRVQELNEERLRFYTNVSHELRTPLTLILGPLDDLIIDTNLSGFYINRIKIIHSSAMSLLNLINQIIDFRKTETQNRKLTVSKEYLSVLVTEIGLRYKELNRNPNVSINTNIETEDTKLYFDSDLVTTILNNLLSNALKYTPKGEITITLRTITEKEKRYAEIEVSDTGYGIEEHQLERIFERYYQVKGKHQASGTGIGLALVKSLTEIHEGVINVKSIIDEGTTFSFRILMDNTYPDALHKEGSIIIKDETKAFETEDQEDFDAQPMVLAIEDNSDILEYINFSLTENYKVILATNGKEGLEMAQKYIPDIIISDIMMPVMDGLDLCRAVKEDINTSHIPVILLTAKDTIRDKEEGYESGADSYLTKPFSAKLLKSRINNLLQSRQELAQQFGIQMKKFRFDEQEEFLSLSKLDEEFINKLVLIIKNNLEINKIDVTFLTEQMNMSASSLYRKIKGLTGMSTNKFIRQIRLKKSLQLLLTDGYNISEAAYIAGFNDLAYYRQCFKDEYGMSPSEYLKTKA